METRVVAAVETLNEGRVWISDELSGQQQLLTAGVAAALLLRSSLAEHNDDLPYAFPIRFDVTLPGSAKPQQSGSE